MLKLEQWNKDKMLSKDFGWFVMVVEDFAKRGKFQKPTKQELKKFWKEATGEDIIEPEKKREVKLEN